MKFDSFTPSTLTKADLAEQLHAEVGLNKRESKDIVDAFFHTICRVLNEGEDVKISGFGNFHVRAKASRPGRNPRTSEVVEIAPRHVVTFQPSAKLKELLQSRAAAPASASGEDGLEPPVV